MSAADSSIHPHISPSTPLIPPTSWPFTATMNTHNHDSSSLSSAFLDVVARIHNFTLSDATQKSSAPRTPAPPPVMPPIEIRSNLDLPSFYPNLLHNYKEDHVPTVIDAFPPCPLTLDLSSISSTSNQSDPSSLSQQWPTNFSFDAFLATRSRVLRLCNLPPMADQFLAAVFLPQSGSVERASNSSIPIPTSMWEFREEYTSGYRDSLWAVFNSHEEACAALTLTSQSLSVATALESDLEPFHKLKRFEFKPAPSTTSTLFSRLTLDIPRPPMLRVSSSYSDLHTQSSNQGNNTGLGGLYTISSNPPNPKTSFRLGDWICGSPKCAAHNFGRNLSCIGCGCPRSTNGNSSSHNQVSNLSAARAAPSPRFNSIPNNHVFYSSSHPSPQQQQSHQPKYAHAQLTYCATPAQTHVPSTSRVSHPPSKPSHPLLTPSGRAFAVGGKVQNISSDPLAPCIMYWPDNEPFPEQGQIRPSIVAGVSQPPILNTGNRGPISHQPGDWICQKCNYLNWRRRKVCQTCLPYAEGNGDSISAAVQAERIALLTSVLSQTQLSAGVSLPSQIVTAPQPPRSQSLTPPETRRPFIDPSPPVNRPVHRSQSHYQLNSQYSNSAPSHYNSLSPIYQTSGHQQQREPSPLYSTGPSGPYISNILNNPYNATVNVNNNVSSNRNDRDMSINTSVHAPAPLLPSFLQDIVQSPSLSPTSTTTSSGDLSSIEEYEDFPTRSMFPRARGSSASSDSNSSIANIWRLDGEESKTWTGIPLVSQQDLVNGKLVVGRELHSQAMS